MPDERTSFKIELSLCDRTIEAEASVPNAPLRVADLLPILHSFDNAVVGMVASKTESDGKKISCRAACGACCRQLVPASEAEAVYLAELVAEMPPERQARVRRRFQEALEALGAPLVERLSDTTKLTDIELRREIGREYFSRGVPCPFLEDESCSIYEHRPMSCREYLVTSPAVNCRTPSAETIRQVVIPLKLSTILYCFGDGVGNEGTRWVPLVSALEWAAARDTAALKRFPGPELFKNFVTAMTKR
ncbi:MAG: YkgJ family cysteine cluster protein [Rhodospirillales bacterium]